MTKLLRLAVTVAALFAASAATAADVEAGRSLASNNCSACHGMDGIGITDQYPNLAGQKAAYLTAQLKAFRDGSRANPIMVPMAKPLTDKEITNVSAYYQSLGCPGGAQQLGPAQPIEQ